VAGRRLLDGYLGPYLAPSGHYTIALPPARRRGDAGVARFRTRIAAEKDSSARFMRLVWARGHFDIAPPGSADLVLTFRNLHN